MRKQLLLSTAALLAGMTLASAQSMPGAQPSGGAAGHERAQSTQSTPSSQGRSGQAQQGAQEQSKQGQSQRSEGRSQHEQTTGQASPSQQGRQGQREQNAQGRHEQTTGQSGRSEREPATGQKTQNQREQGKQAQQPARSEREPATKQIQPQTQGQATQQRNQSQPSERQQAQPQQGQNAQPKQGQAQRTQPQQGEARQNQQGFAPGQTQTSGAAGGHVTLSADQQARIRETVLARSDVPRLNNVNFALSVGTIVPSQVHVVAVPETLVSIYPEWRDDMYFVVREDIIIVDHSHRIVAVLPVGSSGARAQYGSSGSQGSGMVMQLGRDEIRQVQIILNQKGFNVGEPDGFLGERTRAALIQFQRQQGFQASGHFDQQTITALGVSKAGAGQQGQQGQPSSTGQAGGTMNQPNANQGTAAGQPSNNQGAVQPSTAGQAGGRAEQPASKAPPANQGTGTSGQSSPQTQQNMNPSTGTGGSMPQQHTR